MVRGLHLLCPKCLLQKGCVVCHFGLMMHVRCILAISVCCTTAACSLSAFREKGDEGSTSPVSCRKGHDSQKSPATAWAKPRHKGACGHLSKHVDVTVLCLLMHEVTVFKWRALGRGGIPFFLLRSFWKPCSFDPPSRRVSCRNSLFLLLILHSSPLQRSSAPWVLCGIKSLCNLGRHLWVSLKIIPRKDNLTLGCTNK